MSAAQSLRTYYHRFLGLGWARVFLVLGIIFVILALASPLWSTTETAGAGDYATQTFGWTSVTTNTYHGGVWESTEILSYNARGFDAHAVANSLGTSYILVIVLLIVFFAAVALFSLEWVHRFPSLGLLILGLIVAVFALVALLYPVLTVPAAAASDIGEPAITGYWGSSGSLSWGAALGWWLLLIAAVLGIVGGLWPYLQSLRAPMVRPPPPREWQVER
jgi:hypothetical protein